MSNPNAHRMHPDFPPLPAEPKGQRFGGPCNVTACQKPGAEHWNTSTLAFYCEHCARKINEVVMSTPPLCIPPDRMPLLSQYKPEGS